MTRGYWLNRVGGLTWGDQLYGDVELTKAQYDELFAYAPEHRAQALALLAVQAEYEEVSKANMEAVIAEVSAHDVAEKAADAAQAVYNEHKAALDATPPIAPGEQLDAAVAAACASVDAALKVAQDARAAAEAASAVTAPLQEKMAALREQVRAMPPRRVLVA
jgi:hypothetical protein